MAIPLKTVIIGAGPVGSLAALYAAQRGHEVELYELRSGRLAFVDPSFPWSCSTLLAGSQSNTFYRIFRDYMTG